MAAFKRLKRELEKIQEDSDNVSAAPFDEEDLFSWKAVIIGPRDTPYEDGIFHLKIEIPMDYPFRPPKVIFITQIFHPNINRKGEICLDILRDRWASSLTIKGVLSSISSLIDSPNPEDPLVPEIAKLYINNKAKFNETARMWTKLHAS